MKALVKGAGVAGLTAAYELALRGAAVTVVEPRSDPTRAASWFAGGMLAPDCERESAEPIVQELGLGAADWWDAALPGHVARAGTLVVAPARDAAELARFAARTSGFRTLGEAEISELEPDLAGRFRLALHFVREAHLDPRAALTALRGRLEAMGASFVGAEAGQVSRFDLTVDCTGMARAASDPALRGVRGEMLILRTPEVTLSRPVRLLHPRFPLYVVPRPDHCFMVGATMIESESARPVTARSMMELLNAAYSVHPAFGEAEIVETGVGVRPAYPDNLPRVTQSGATISINGLYRHGFLLAPAMAQRAAQLAFGNSRTRELAHEAHG
ncbi:glycine oxidase ThiO [Pseudaminobacter soli (ex Li et al. 2025)]|uniref:D-amino-acid oxidase n=1 Tax=Pseudaminobacter soli (ex Li et al. 2025) TaxID=1295366 RepID=A0A2P7SKI1_9HYPH|nr:glycine oxidase ThiO [Mesorhizobium soli]PSJ62999.1 glycine oxidase ThiO [Mesorhizobium soli]